MASFFHLKLFLELRHNVPRKTLRSRMGEHEDVFEYENSKSAVNK